MKRSIAVACAAVCLSTTAFADHHNKMDATKTGTNPHAQHAMDMSKMGPATRKVKDEGAVKKEINAFIKEMETIEAKNDFMAMVGQIDFPVMMMTDSTTGGPESKAYSREEYIAMMKPMHDNMPKDLKMKHNTSITVLSDMMATVSDNHTTTIGKEKYEGKSISFITKKNGKWMWKVMAEPGWGGMESAMGGSGSMTHDMQNKMDATKTDVKGMQKDMMKK